MESRFPGGSVVKNMPDNTGEEMRVRCLSQEDPMEKEMATHSTILAWQIPGQRSGVSYSLQCCKEANLTERLNNNIGRDCFDYWLLEN